MQGSTACTARVQRRQDMAGCTEAGQGTKKGIDRGQRYDPASRYEVPSSAPPGRANTGPEEEAC